MDGRTDGERAFEIVTIPISKSQKRKKSFLFLFWKHYLCCYNFLPLLTCLQNVPSLADIYHSRLKMCMFKRLPMQVSVLKWQPNLNSLIQQQLIHMLDCWPYITWRKQKNRRFNLIWYHIQLSQSYLTIHLLEALCQFPGSFDRGPIATNESRLIIGTGAYWKFISYYVVLCCDALP